MKGTHAVCMLYGRIEGESACYSDELFRDMEYN